MSDDRLNNLEARYAWLERHVAEQDKAMAGLGDELRRTRRELESLRKRLLSAGEADDAGKIEERPPHY
jgi:uncharacterized coiled-coil protein SlyX